MNDSNTKLPAPGRRTPPAGSALTFKMEAGGKTYEGTVTVMEDGSDGPVTSHATGIEAMVCADIAARQQSGIWKYGCTVEDSPDDMLRHAYEEALDLAVYLKAELERRGR